MKEVYRTDSGIFLLGKAENMLDSELLTSYQNNIDLIFTSPPFPLSRKKKYGNRDGEDYVEWVASFAPIFRSFLKPTGSIVIEIGNSWEKGRPVMSTLALQALLAFLDAGEFTLCQQLIWYNPAKLPTPAQWVNVKRTRLKDAYTNLWWMSTTDNPKADNRNVLTEYSASMKQLLKSQKYNPGKRPSEHQIGAKSFLTDNNGAIPSNVLSLSNTQANSNYLIYCRANNIEPHPARMPIALPKFFIEFLTDPGDCILDPFAGSNTTGAAAQQINRRWVSIEADSSYIEGSKGHFVKLDTQSELDALELE